MVSAVGGAGSRRIGRAVAKPSSASPRAGAPGGLAQVYHRAGPSLDPAAQLILHNITARTHATPVGLLAVPYRRNALSGLEWDDFSSNRHPALPYCWSVIFSENRAHFSRSCSSHLAAGAAPEPLEAKGYSTSHPHAWLSCRRRHGAQSPPNRNMHRLQRSD